jgi:hypothetical protein
MLWSAASDSPCSHSLTAVSRCLSSKSVKLCWPCAHASKALAATSACRFCRTQVMLACCTHSVPQTQRPYAVLCPWTPAQSGSEAISSTFTDMQWSLLQHGLEIRGNFAKVQCKREKASKSPPNVNILCQHPCDGGLSTDGRLKFA